MKIQDRLLFLGLATIAVGAFVYSQIYYHNKNREELLEIAREIALNWQEKLLLTPQQTFLLENIIIEYTIKKNEIINADVPSDIKIARLQKVQVREHKNLQNFLDEDQFKAYVGINKKIPNKIMDSLSA